MSPCIQNMVCLAAFHEFVVSFPLCLIYKNLDITWSSVLSNDSSERPSVKYITSQAGHR